MLCFTLITYIATLVGLSLGLSCLSLINLVYMLKLNDYSLDAAYLTYLSHRGGEILH
jgi:hypothetical protein